MKQSNWADDSCRHDISLADLEAEFNDIYLFSPIARFAHQNSQRIMKKRLLFDLIHSSFLSENVIYFNHFLKKPVVWTFVSQRRCHDDNGVPTVFELNYTDTYGNYIWQLAPSSLQLLFERMVTGSFRKYPLPRHFRCTMDDILTSHRSDSFDPK